MSLDVYLRLPGVARTVEARIFIREDGGTREITRAEWDALPAITDEQKKAKAKYQWKPDPKIVNQLVEAERAWQP